MENLLNAGIEIIVWMQQASPTLDLIFQFFTFLGDEVFFLVFMPVIIWCVDYARGFRLTMLFLFSAYLNSFAKALGQQPRPFEYDPRAKKLVEATGYGLPSGHTQSTVTIWGYLAVRFKNRAVQILAVVLIIMIPLSRIYLGVHFPTDVIGGYILGFLIVFIYFKIEEPIVSFWQRRTPAVQLVIAVLLPLLLMLVYPGEINGSIPTCATLMGGIIGIVLADKWLEFNAGGIWWKRVLRYVAGMVVVALVYFGLSMAFKGLEPAPVFRFVRYILVGFSIVFLVPKILISIKLADR